MLGGSAVGITARRRHHPDQSILSVRKEQQAPIPCGVPYIYGRLASPDKHLIPDSVLTAIKIDLLITEATKIDRQHHCLVTDNAEVQYEPLILVMGCVPTQPPIPGVDFDGVFTVLKDVKHLARLRERLKRAENVVIIDGGFIKIQFADEISKFDSREVTVLGLAGNCLSLSHDVEFCPEMEELLCSRGLPLG